VTYRDQPPSKPAQPKPTGVLVDGGFWSGLLCAVFGHAENHGWMERRVPEGQRMRMGSRCATCGRLVAFYVTVPRPPI
jgi:hypothetical protein